MKTFVHVCDDRSLGGVVRMLETIRASALSSEFDMETRTLPEALALDVDRVEAFIVHEPASWASLRHLVRLRRRRPVIYVEHHYSRSFEALKVPRPTRFRAMLRLAYRLASRVVAVSEAQRDWMLEHRLASAEKISLVSPVVDLSRFFDLPLSEWRGERPLILGAYGRFDEQKGFPELLEALATRPDLPVRLRLGGYGPQEDRLRALAAADRRIELLGKISNVRGFLGSIDLAVIPSLWEPYGLTCLESRAAGRPVLVSQVDALPEQARGCGLSFGLATEVPRLVEEWSPDRQASWGRSARRSAMGFFEQNLDRWGGLMSNVSTVG